MEKGKMKLTRWQIFSIFIIIFFVGSHVAPMVGASNPIIETGKIIGTKIYKIINHVDLQKAHKVIDAAFQKIKEHPVKYGLETVGFVGTVTTLGEGIQFIINTHDVRLEHNDDAECLNIYVKGELVGAIAYNKLVNLNEDEVGAKIKDAIDNAITVYQVRHK